MSERLDGSQMQLIARMDVWGKDGSLKSTVEKRRTVARLFKRIIVRNAQGKVKRDSGLIPSHSYTLQFLQIVEARLRDTSVHTRDITNTLRNLTFAPSMYGTSDAFSAGAADNVDTYGIVVGTGVGAESNIDYKLGTKITHGFGAGQLDYGPASYVTPYVNDGYADLVISRSFYNGSGSPITVNEFGVYVRTDSPYYFCIIRDVELGKIVEAGDTMTVQWTLRVQSGFTLNWWLCFGCFLVDTTFSAPDVTGATRSSVGMIGGDSGRACWTSTNIFYGTPAVEDQTIGLVIGSGTNAEALTDYALQTKITTVSYGAQNTVAAQVVGANVDLIITRSFFNNSAVAVTVCEAGFYIRDICGAYSYYFFCVIRDVFPAGVLIDVADTGTIQYTLRTSVGV